MITVTLSPNGTRKRKFPNSLVVIVPANLRASVLSMGVLLGVDGGLNIRLSKDGFDSATHYGSHSWASAQFTAVMTGRAVPDPMPPGVTAIEILGVLSAIIVSANPSVDGRTLRKREHFDHVISSLKLTRIEEPLED